MPLAKPRRQPPWFACLTTSVDIFLSGNMPLQITSLVFRRTSRPRGSFCLFSSVHLTPASGLLRKFLESYVVLNPVRAGMVKAPGDYEWSSYLPTLGKRQKPDLLTTEWILANSACIPAKIEQISVNLYEAKIVNFKPKEELSVFFGNARQCNSRNTGVPPKIE